MYVPCTHTLPCSETQHRSTLHTHARKHRVHTYTCTYTVYIKLHFEIFLSLLVCTCKKKNPKITWLCCAHYYRYKNFMQNYMWQSRVEIEGYSVAYFDRIVAFEAPYRWTSVKGGAYMHFVNGSSAIQRFKGNVAIEIRDGITTRDCHICGNFTAYSTWIGTHTHTHTRVDPNTCEYIPIQAHTWLDLACFYTR